MKRDPLQVSPLFKIRIVELQKKIELKEKKNVSVREITERIAKLNLIDDLEKKMLNITKAMDIDLNFDRRKT